ncbi:MAG: PQQ-dependent sugar dehydrogenase, partial [Caldilineaceae bacterium]|nr:PQQ-dependent sugar dehydrogenase [Caldilineaceae bacterium]
MSQEQVTGATPHPVTVRTLAGQRRGLLFAILLAFLALGTLSLLSVAPATAGEPGVRQAGQGVPALALDPFASGFSLPVGIVSAGDDRLFVVEKAGQIRILQSDGTTLEPPFLNITATVRADDQEQGLLGLVFEPNDVTTFYIYYIARSQQFGEGVITIARYHTMTDTIDVADPNSAEILFTQPKPYTNHNAGDMAFGPDGNLYIAIGDGGGGGDPDELAQDLSQYFGKILRIYVTGVPTYTVPADNPFADDGDPTTLPEIWAYGMRNPWR